MQVATYLRAEHYMAELIRRRMTELRQRAWSQDPTPARQYLDICPGTCWDRSAMARLLESCSREPPCVVIVESYASLSANVADLAVLHRYLTTCGVSLRSSCEPPVPLEPWSSRDWWEFVRGSGMWGYRWLAESRGLQQLLRRCRLPRASGEGPDRAVPPSATGR